MNTGSATRLLVFWGLYEGIPKPETPAISLETNGSVFMSPHMKESSQKGWALRFFYWVLGEWNIRMGSMIIKVNIGTMDGSDNKFGFKFRGYWQLALHN